jgi:hypothetical protein
MPEVAFVMSERQQHPLRELAATLGHELELQIVPASLHVGEFPEARPSLVYILLDSGGFVAAEGAPGTAVRVDPSANDLSVRRGATEEGRR